MWNVECKVVGEEWCKLWNVKYRVWNAECLPNFLSRNDSPMGKLASRNETRGCKKKCISYEMSSNFDIYYKINWIIVKCYTCDAKLHNNYSNKKYFLFSYINTATP